MSELGGNIRDYLETHFGSEYVTKYSEYLETDRHSYIRMNPVLIDDESLIKRLKKYNISLSRIDSIPNAYRVESGREVIGKTLDFILGYYYIQSLSSMVPPVVLAPQPGEKVLDLCAAPGSKTTQLAEMMNNTGTLYANEVASDRVKMLVHNMEKMCVTNLGIINFRGEQLSKFFANHFDKILVDAPCSALGILQKKGEVNNWWNKRHADKLAEMQNKLLVSAVKMVREGGEILYSTCTLTLEENEYAVNKILESYPVELVDVELPVKSMPAFTKYGDIQLDESLSKAHRIIPWEAGSEGFFVAKFRKTARTENAKPFKIKRENVKFFEVDHPKYREHFKEIESRFGVPIDILAQYKYYEKKNEIFFIKKEWEMPGQNLFERFGQKFGQIDRNNYLHLKTYTARIFGEYVSGNIVELSEPDDIKTYFEGGTIRKDFGVPGKTMISIDSRKAGTAISSAEGLKSQFPRALRTQEIVYPF